MIQTDASQNGIGCCLVQNNMPIAYASRSLSDTERRYAQIEKEFLPVEFPCKKFRSVIIKNDHKPLEFIMKKEIHKVMSARLQRIRLKLLKYELHFEYLRVKIYISQIIYLDIILIQIMRRRRNLFQIRFLVLM